MAPWTAVPPLVALTSDPESGSGDHALRLLKRLADKHTDFMSSYLGVGLLAMHDFQERLAASRPGKKSPSGASSHSENRRIHSICASVSSPYICRGMGQEILMGD